ncbi:SDR family NAD(P)-dependent oxidoreductase [Aestuariirhabdus litorea]|uniref:SDR family NAD(P)-dependent oxidoreductase n=1 Tax=Aestuariirhabdus litorea TaxID=2528527 RepID=A0A3P3VQA5_9GAMM|nr:SDR family NAD(P)-dependent oxidoreductase [Aestuariirhabdus litorea]RRJ83836.1 SDR family NAD(P)-dependent oxidoreductase [Aestuariirhabdus litorea]RWW97059.1 SDR family NAD(P)-dependent oxidoreductase [Endozoicomonadaceae bacterium GTF-13]
MKESITDKTVLVTGASSGIGRELALQLARAGNFVIAVGRDSHRLSHLQQADPARIHPLPLDLGDENASRQLQQALKGVTDHLDLLLMSAGCCEYVDGIDWEPALFERVMRGNFFTAVNSISACLPLLSAASGRPQIVGLSSLSTEVGLPRAEAYGASKAALHYLLDALRLDLSHRGIDVTVVRPGFIRTPLTANNDFPMPFMMGADEAAQRIIQAVSRRQRTVIFPKRLWLPLWLANKLPTLWYRWIGPKLTRENSI